MQDEVDHAYAAYLMARTAALEKEGGPGGCLKKEGFNERHN